MATNMTSTTIIAQWGPVEPCADQKGVITGYSVRYGSETVSVSGDSSGGMTTITGLSPSTTYSIQVAAETSAGTGVYSSAVDQLTEGVYSVHRFRQHVVEFHFLTVSAPVVTADSTTATTISLSWTSGGSEGVSYKVDWQRVTTEKCPDMDQGSMTINDGSTNTVLLGLEEDSSYSIHVRASNTAGSTKTSNTLTTTTIEAGIFTE